MGTEAHRAWGIGPVLTAEWWGPSAPHLPKVPESSRKRRLQPQLLLLQQPWQRWRPVALRSKLSGPQRRVPPRP